MLCCHIFLISYNWISFLAFLCLLWQWHFWRCSLPIPACSLFSWMFLLLGLSDVSLWLDSGAAPMARTLHEWYCVLLRVTPGGTQCPSSVVVVFYPGCHWEVVHVMGSGNLHQGGHHSARSWAWGDTWYLMLALEDHVASQEAPSWVWGETSRLIHSFHTTHIYWAPVWAGTGLQRWAGAYLHDAYSQAERTTGEKIAASPASRPVPVT